MLPASARRIGLAATGAVAIAAGGGSLASSGGSTRPAAPPAAHRPDVLVLTQTRGYYHAAIPWAVDTLKMIAARDRRYRLTFLSSATSLAQSLKGASAVVLLLTSGELPLSPAGRAALQRFVEHGGALGFHSATDTFHHWPGFIHLIGAEFSHHPLPSTQRVVVEDRADAATGALGASFLIREEFYVFKHDPRSGVHVLARLDTGPGGPDRPLVWCRRIAHGRVFYDALGHFRQTWQDPRQISIVTGGLAWALGLAPQRC